MKILKSLNRTWQPKVTTISESRDLTTMNMTTLFGKLREHELELGRLKEEKKKGRKDIALKTSARIANIPSSRKNDSADDQEVEYSNSEALNFMVKKFPKFLKYKKKKANNDSARNRRFY